MTNDSVIIRKSKIACYSKLHKLEEIGNLGDSAKKSTRLHVISEH